VNVDKKREPRNSVFYNNNNLMKHRTTEEKDLKRYSTNFRSKEGLLKSHTLIKNEDQKTSIGTLIRDNTRHLETASSYSRKQTKCNQEKFANCKATVTLVHSNMRNSSLEIAKSGSLQNTFLDEIKIKGSRKKF
jgi:hypothetical protein